VCLLTTKKYHGRKDLTDERAIMRRGVKVFRIRAEHDDAEGVGGSGKNLDDWGNGGTLAE